MQRKTLILGTAACALAWGASAYALDRWGHLAARFERADAIVVLGARVVPPGVAGVSLRARANRAAELFAAGVAPNVLCTGGVGHTPPAESIAAETVLMQRSVPQSAIAREELSTSTWGNASEAAAICRARGWTRVIVVSDAYHLWRATRNFQKLGLEAAPMPALDAQPTRRVWMALREAVLVLRDGCLRRV
jgi:uncharacterized SAM-binding protein YcdF (DUF218 family)